MRPTLPLLAILCLVLAACGGPAPHTDDIVVRRYEDVSGHPVSDGTRLGFTYYIESSNARHGADGWNCLVSDVLAEDDDGDRIVRVVVHELENVLVLNDGDRYAPDYPPTYASDWYLADGDSRAPFYAIPPDEAAWLASHGTFNVRARDAWLQEPTREAIDRLNSAAGRIVFEGD